MTRTVATPIGPVTIYADEEYITGLYFGERGQGEGQSPLVLDECEKELNEYFAGKRKVFTVPIKAEGTPFREKVWDALCQVPYGETASYLDIAVAIGNPKAVRAVGGANHNNPISIIIPCHRIIGSDGSLTGYGGGLSAKEWLLDFEAKYKKQSIKASINNG